MRQTLALCCVDASRVPADVMALGVELARERAADRATGQDFLRAARSLIKLLTRPQRLNEAMTAITAPVLLIHGDSDRLVPLRTAKSVAAAHRSWQFEIAERVGHVPQLEVPEWTAGVVRRWMHTNALVG